MVSSISEHPKDDLPPVSLALDWLSADADAGPSVVNSEAAAAAAGPYAFPALGSSDSLP